MSNQNNIMRLIAYLIFGILVTALFFTASILGFIHFLPTMPHSFTIPLGFVFALTLSIVLDSVIYGAYHNFKAEEGEPIDDSKNYSDSSGIDAIISSITII